MGFRQFSANTQSYIDTMIIVHLNIELVKTLR